MVYDERCSSKVKIQNSGDILHVFTGSIIMSVKNEIILMNFS